MACAVMLFLAAMAGQGCGALTRELEQVDTQHALSEINVKAALIDEPSVDAASVQVSLKDDVIELTGFVGSQAESDTAKQVAQENSGGLTVVNLLEIR